MFTKHIALHSILFLINTGSVLNYAIYVVMVYVFVYCRIAHANRTVDSGIFNAVIGFKLPQSQSSNVYQTAVHKTLKKHEEIQIRTHLWPGVRSLCNVLFLCFSYCCCCYVKITFMQYNSNLVTTLQHIE